MDVFPCFWQLEGRTVLVVGSGDAAARKLRLLARTPARLTVFAEDKLHGEIEAYRKADRIEVLRALPSAADIPADTAFAIVATDDDGLAEEAVALFNAARVPVNAVDRTEKCDFTVPSIVDRGSVVVGIATGGAAPVLARNIRETVETILPERLGELARFAARFRPAVAGTIPAGKTRKAFWERFFDGPIAQKVLDGDETGAREAMLSDLNRGDAQREPEGSVAVIELDPATPDLLSLRGLRLLQRADIVYHDRHFDGAVLDLVRRDADRGTFRDSRDAVDSALDAQSKGLSAIILTLPGTAPGTFETLRHGPASQDAAPAVRYA